MLPEEPKLTYAADGTPPWPFTLRMGEHGQAYTPRLYVRRDVSGDRAENVPESISAGDTRRPHCLDGT